MIKKGNYVDGLSHVRYKIEKDLNPNSKIIRLKGDNGVGKTRFVEGILLKELKKQKKRILYIGQDLENQILSHELIKLVDSFVTQLKNSGDFFKAILLNDESHHKIELDFNSDKVLNPGRLDKKTFIMDEITNIENADYIILDEVDKYFDNFIELLNLLKNKDARVVIISHLLDDIEDIFTIELKNIGGITYVG
jgi:translation initiation factor RLI1